VGAAVAGAAGIPQLCPPALLRHRGTCRLGLPGPQARGRRDITLSVRPRAEDPTPSRRSERNQRYRQEPDQRDDLLLRSFRAERQWRKCEFQSDFGDADSADDDGQRVGGRTHRPPHYQPYVYGVNFPPDAAYIADTNTSLVRWGGNASSTYNWQLFTYNADNGYSVHEVVAAVERVTGHKVPTHIGPRRAGDPAELAGQQGGVQVVAGNTAGFYSFSVPGHRRQRRVDRLGRLGFGHQACGDPHENWR
jgi:hypothetical protein